MTTTYKNVPMAFNVSKFASDVLHEVEVIKSSSGYTDIEISALLMDMSEGTIAEIRSHRKDGLLREGDNHVFGMRRFITICNIFGLDPRDYFELSE